MNCCLVYIKLMYCSLLWRPHLIKDIQLLERVQSRATEYIPNDYFSDYKSRLTNLNLLPLMYFYELNDIIFLFNHTSHPPLILASTIMSPFPIVSPDLLSTPNYFI